MSERLPETAEVVIVGAGIVGCATALRLAEAGARPVVVDKEVGPAGEASGRAQGALRALGKHDTAILLTIESLADWKELARDNEADAEIVLEGSISVARAADELPRMLALADDHARLAADKVEALDVAGVRARAPALQGPIAGGVWRAGDGHCHPRKSTLHLARLAERAGARFHFGIKALKVLERGGQVTGLETNAGSIATGRIVLAAGLWTPLLARTVGVRIPIMPLILSGCETTPVPPLFRQSVRSFGFSGHQRPNGRVVLSAGVNARVRHEASLTTLADPAIWWPRLMAHWRNVSLRLDGRRIARQVELRDRWSTGQIIEETAPKFSDRRLMQRALGHAQSLIPALREARIARTWSGTIDMSPDALPIIDYRSCPDGMAIAAGLSGHGLVMGPVLGRVLADLALAGTTARPIVPFRLARFVEEKVPIPASTI